MRCSARFFIYQQRITGVCSVSEVCCTCHYTHFEMRELSLRAHLSSHLRAEALQGGGVREEREGEEESAINVETSKSLRREKEAKARDPRNEGRCSIASFLSDDLKDRRRKSV